jgi:hypothetical protein
MAELDLGRSYSGCEYTKNDAMPGQMDTAADLRWRTVQHKDSPHRAVSCMEGMPNASILCPKCYTFSHHISSKSSKLTVQTPDAEQRSYAKLVVTAGLMDLVDQMPTPAVMAIARLVLVKAWGARGLRLNNLNGHVWFHRKEDQTPDETKELFAGLAHGEDAGSAGGFVQPLQKNTTTVAVTSGVMAFQQCECGYGCRSAHTS